MHHELISIFIDLKPYLKSNTITLETLRKINNSNIQNKSFNITYAINILKKSNNNTILNEIYANLDAFKIELLESIINTIDSQTIDKTTFINLVEFNRTLLKRGLKYEALFLLKKLGRKNQNLDFYKQLYEISIENFYYLSAFKCLKAIQKANYILCIKDKQKFQQEIYFLKENVFKEEIDFDGFFDESINLNYSFEIEDLNLKECDGEEYLKEITNEEKVFLKKMFENQNKFVPSNDILSTLIKHDIQFEADDGRLKILGYKYENLKDKVDLQIRNMKKEKKKDVEAFAIKPEQSKPIQGNIPKKQTKIDYFSEDYHKFRVYLRNTKTVNFFNPVEYKKRLKTYKKFCEQQIDQKCGDKQFILKNAEKITEDINKLKLKIENAPPKLKQLTVSKERETTEFEAKTTEENENWRLLPPVEVKSQSEFFIPKRRPSEFFTSTTAQPTTHTTKKNQPDFASQFMSNYKASKGRGEDFAEIRRKHLSESKETKNTENKADEKKRRNNRQQNSSHNPWRD